MFDNLSTLDLLSYFNEIQGNPWLIAAFVCDILILLFFIYEFIKFANKSKAWQLIKGIAILVVMTFLSNLLNLKILNFILTSFISYGVIAIIIIFQPELRRGLEKLGSSGFFKSLALSNDLRTKAKEDIYKVAIAAEEMASTKTGALIVFENEIRLQEVIENGVLIDSEVSPQLLCNIFVPNTPLHDGAVIIRDNAIAAAACILPVADDKSINKKYGTRHRAAIEITKETDAIAVVVSEETGKISIAKDGTLIEGVTDDALKRILIKHLVVSKFGSDNSEKIKKIKEDITDRKSKKKKKEDATARYEKLKNEISDDNDSEE